MTRSRWLRAITVMLMAIGLVQTVPPAGAVFPGENGRILFHRSENGGAHFQVVLPDGTSQPGFGSDHYGVYPMFGSWSPDGTKVAYSETCCPPTELYVLDYASLTEHALGISHTQAPEWSPDGKKLVFDRDVGGSREIFVTDALDGSGTTQLTNFSAQPSGMEGRAVRPNWSPDGGLIAFSGTTRVVTGTGAIENRQGIWTMNRDGSDPRLVAGGTDVFEYNAPDWSPDGQQIVFDSNFSGTQEIYTVPRTGGTPTLIPTGGGAEPAWSPDGKQLAFQRGGDIYTVPISGGTPVLLRSCSGNFSCNAPDWAVVPPPPVQGCTPGPGVICGTSEDDEVVISEGTAETGAGNDEVLVQPTEDTTGITVDASGGKDQVTVDLSRLSEEAEPNRLSNNQAEAVRTITLKVGAGNDTINVRGFLPAGWRLVTDGADGADVMNGNPDATTRAIAGYVFNGGGGTDKLNGSAAKDKLVGGAANDILSGGRGSDLVNGGAGKDICYHDRKDQLKSCEVKRFRRYH